MYTKLKKWIRTKPSLVSFAFRCSMYLELLREKKRPYIIKATNKAAARGKKGVVYTCILGGYDILREPVCCPIGIEYIAYTDAEIDNYKGEWKIRPIPKSIARLADNTLINRYIKLHPVELLGKDHDYAVYVDGNITVKKDIRGYCDIVEKSKTGLAIHRHMKRQNVYEEAKTLLQVGKGNRRAIETFIEKCKANGLPENSGLFEAAVIAVDLHNERAENILNEWYQLLVSSEVRRDQLILPFILWKNNISIDDITNLGDNIYLNPMFKIGNHCMH